MAYEEILSQISLEADATCWVYTGAPGTRGSAEPNSGFQYRFVKVTGAQTCGLAVGAANELVIGVLQNKPQMLSAAATVAVDGVSLVEAAASINAGQGVKVDAAGKAILWVAGTDAIQLCVGVATTAGVSGALMSVLLRR